MYMEHYRHNRTIKNMMQTMLCYKQQKITQTTKSKPLRSSYHIFAAEISDKGKVVSIIHVAVAHKQQILFAYHLLYTSRHLVAKQTFLLAFVHKFRQLLQTVLSLTHAVKHVQHCHYYCYATLNA